MRDNFNIKRAILFAQEAHVGQTYSDVYPYTRHLEMVYEVLLRFGFDDETLLISAWLHDVIEDTDVTYQMVKVEFGLEVAEAVYGVTDELGRNRKERKAKTYPKILANHNSLILKLADRIANVEFGSSVFGDPSKKKMYIKEQPEFEQALELDKFQKKWATDKYDNPEEIEADDRKLLRLWWHLREILKEN